MKLTAWPKVGVGASRVRDIFKQAKDMSWCVCVCVCVQLLLLLLVTLPQTTRFWLVGWLAG